MSADGLRVKSRREPRGRVRPSVLIFVAAASTLVMATVPHWAALLVTERPVRRCDLMVVLGGGSVERLATAAELMSGGACSRVLFTGQQPAGGLRHVRSFLAEVDPALRLSPAWRTYSTVGDALLALEAARKLGAGYLLIVTSPYHTKRAEWVFSRVLEGEGIRFGVHPSTAFYFSYDSWWGNPLGRRIVLKEYLKLWACGLAAEAMGIYAGTAAAIL